ncbi:o-methyltransferase 1, partial [Genlisea aurea]
SDDRDFFSAMQLSFSSVLPMALKTAIQLNLLELINQAPGGSISASDLAGKLPTTNPAAGKMIDRILCLLAAHDVVVCRIVPSPHGGGGGGGVERIYSPGTAAKLLTKNEEGISLARIFMLVQDNLHFKAWHNLKDAILEGGEAFHRAYGKSIFDHIATDQEYNKVFNAAMFSHTKIFMNKLLRTYTGFEGLKSIVDVGGGVGVTLKMIIDEYPSIRGINFDLPHVIDEALPFPGIEHVAGDMFVSVPKADAIFLKWICHDWSDEHCKQLLRNCYDALGDDGKVILVDAIMSDEPKTTSDFKYTAATDVLMMSCCPGGTERTEEEFNGITRDTGFKKFRKMCCIYGTWIMELRK